MNPVPTCPNAAMVRTDGAAAASGATILPPTAPNGTPGGGGFAALLRGLSLPDVEDAGMRQPRLGRASAAQTGTKLGDGGQSVAIAPTRAEVAIADEAGRSMVAGHFMPTLRPSEGQDAPQFVRTGELATQEGDLEGDEGEHLATLPPSIVPDHTGPITPSPGLTAHPASLVVPGDGSLLSSLRPDALPPLDNRAAAPDLTSRATGLTPTPQSAVHWAASSVGADTIMGATEASLTVATAQAALAAGGNFRTVETAINDVPNAFGTDSRYVDAQITSTKEKIALGQAAPATAPSTESPEIPTGAGAGPSAAPSRALFAPAADHPLASVPASPGSAEEGPTRATPRLSRGALVHPPPTSPSLTGVPPGPAAPPPADAAVPVLPDLPSETPDAPTPVPSAKGLASSSEPVLATAPHGPKGPIAAVEASSLPGVAAASALSGTTASGLAAVVAETTGVQGLVAPHAAPMPPARQLAPQIVALSLKTGGAEGSAPGRIELLLEPAELGRVEIRVEPGTGPTDTTAVRILAERPETLALLQRDARELDRALNQAGLGADTGTGGGGFTLSFALGSGARQGSDGEGSSSDAGASTGLRRRVIAAGNVTGTAAPAVHSLRGPALALLDIAV